MCGPYKVLEPQVYDMQLLGDTHIYQWGSISPPCMVLLQWEQQEEAVCVLLVNGETMCSQEAVNQSLSLWGEPNTELKFLRSVPTTNTLHNVPDNSLFGWICKSVSMRKYTLKSHKSSCLSVCIFKAECSLWIWGLTAGPSVISQRESEPAVEISLTVRGATSDERTAPSSGQQIYIKSAGGWWSILWSSLSLSLGSPAASTCQTAESVNSHRFQHQNHTHHMGQLVFRCKSVNILHSRSNPEKSHKHFQIKGTDQVLQPQC